MTIITISVDAGVEGFASVLDHLRGLCFNVRNVRGEVVALEIVKTSGTTELMLEALGWDEGAQDFRTPIVLAVDDLVTIEYL